MIYKKISFYVIQSFYFRIGILFQTDCKGLKRDNNIFIIYRFRNNNSFIK